MLALSRRLRISGTLAVVLLGVAGCGSSHTGVARAVPTTRPAPTAANPGTTTPGATTPGTSTPGTSAPGITAPATTTTLPPMTATGPAATLFRRALADAAGERWVHGVTTTTAEGAATFISDNGPAQGTQDITVEAVAGDIRVIGARTYIRGGPAALVELFDVPATQAARLGDTWVRLQPGDSDYASVTAGVTMSSFLAETGFSGTVTEATTTLRGAGVTVIRGRLASAAGTGTGSLYVSRGTRPLPLEWKVIQTDGTTTTRFSAWGRSVRVVVPPGAVPLPVTPGTTITVGLDRPA